MELTNIRIDLRDGSAVNMLYRPGTKDRPTIAFNWQTHPYRLAKYPTIARRQFIDQEYRRILDEGGIPLIVDLGANIGASVLFFRWRYPEARILAVEPDPTNFHILVRNVGQTSMSTCVRAAIASKDGTLRLCDSGRGEDAYRVIEPEAMSANGVDLGAVQAISMATLLSDAADATPLLAKIDIEGGEADLFSANTDWVDDFPAIAMELHDWMLPGRASSASFLACVGAKRRDFINPENSDTVFSLRN